MSAAAILRRQRARNAARREQICHHAARGDWTIVHRLADEHRGQTGETLAQVLAGAARGASR